MDIGGDEVPDPTTAFGELFENDLGCHVPDDVLESLTHEIGLDAAVHHHQTSGQASEHDILAANLPFVPDDYLQQQHHIGINDGANYMVHPPVTDVGQYEAHHIENQHQQQLQQDFSQQQQIQQQIYVQDPNVMPASEHQVGNAEQSQFSLPNYSNNEVSNLGFEQGQLSQGQQGTEGPNKDPPGKRKRKVVKSVVHFTRKNMENYMIRRGFKKKNQPQMPIHSISKAVLALTADKEISQARSKIVSFGSSYEPESVIQEMERFWKFYLSTKKSPHSCMSPELLPMLIPMLLQFYFDMSLANMFPMARRIFQEFSKKFFHEDKTQEQYEILVSLAKINSLEVLKSDSNIAQLMKRKYEFVLSEATLLHLRRFLSKSTQPILVNLFTDRFKIRLRESTELFESFDWEGMLDSDEYSSSSDSDYGDDDDQPQQNPEGVVKEQTQTKEQKPPEEPRVKDFYISERRIVKEVINEVRNSVSANLPAISVYTVGQKPICGAVSKTGSVMAFGLTECGIRVCSVENARDVVTSFRPNENQNSSDNELDAPGVVTLGGHAGTVYGVHFHPRTKLLFSVGQDSFMRAWDLNSETPQCKAVYRGHVGPIWSIDIPESGSLIATSGLDTTARIFLPERNEFVRIMAGHYFSVNTVKFHPNEAYIATGSTDNTVRLWSVNDGNIMRMYTGTMASVSSLAFHESGKYLAGAGEENKILIWDLAKGEVIATLDSLNNCRDLVFNGSMLSAGFRNGMLQIFNLRPIVGGSTHETFERRKRVSIFQPVTFNCYAETLFKVHYKDPGRLFCLGSDVAPFGFDVKNISNETSDADITVNDETVNSQIQEHYSIDPSLDAVVPSRMSTASSDAEDASQDGNLMDSTNTILSSRMSQPPSNSSMSGDDSTREMNLIQKDVTTLPGLAPESVPTPTTTATKSTISLEDLDAAIASVIDQSGGDNSSDARGGTITMYASN